MTVRISNLGGFLKGIEALKSLPEDIIRKKMTTILRLAHEKVTIRTPVYTGKSLRNWVWTMDKPSSASNMEALGSGDPGRTSQMRLGSEPRRPANQAAVDATFAALDLSKPMRSYWLTNNSDQIVDLEYGKLPSPGSSRNPAGMVRVTVEEILQALRTGK